MGLVSLQLLSTEEAVFADKVGFSGMKTGRASKISDMSTSSPQSAADWNAPISRILRVWSTARLKTGRCLEFMRFGDPGARPLLMLHSLEYAAAPPWPLCLAAKEAGFQTIAVRRPGFGKSNALATIDDQVAAISDLLSQLDVHDVLLQASGTSGQLACDLILREPRITCAIFSNFSFGPSAIEVLKPSWVQSVVKQSLQSEAAAELTLKSVKSILKLRGAGWFLRQVCSRSDGDLRFISDHEPELAEAADAFMSLNATCFRLEVFATRIATKTLDALKSHPTPLISIIGGESSDVFRAEAVSRAKYIGAYTVITETGDVFCGALKMQRSRYFWNLIDQANN